MKVLDLVNIKFFETESKWGKVHAVGFKSMITNFEECKLLDFYLLPAKLEAVVGWVKIISFKRNYWWFAGVPEVDEE